MVASIEEVSSSLVREYLSRKGLKKTMACMEEELPRTEASINNRFQLRQMLSIENLYRKNKVQNSPLKTLLEMIVKCHMEQLSHNKISVSVIPEAQSPTVISASKSEERAQDLDLGKRSESRSTVQETCPSKLTNKSPLAEKCRLSSYKQADFLIFDAKDQSSVAFPPDSDSVVQKEPEKNASVMETVQRSRTNRVRRGMMAGPIPQESNKKRHSRKAEVPQPLLRRDEGNRPSQDGVLPTGFVKKSFGSSRTPTGSPDCEGEEEEAQSLQVNTDTENTFEKVQQKIKKVKMKSNVDLNLAEMVLDDFDDDDDENLRKLCKSSLLTTPAAHSFVGHQIDQHTAMPQLFQRRVEESGFHFLRNI